MRWLLSLWQQWKEFEAHYHAVWYRRRIDEFIAADPINGRIVNATEWKIIFAATIAYVGVCYLLINLLILLQLENQYIENVLIVATVHWGYMPVILVSARIWYVRGIEWQLILNSRSGCRRELDESFGFCCPVRHGIELPILQ